MKRGATIWAWQRRHDGVIKGKIHVVYPVLAAVGTTWRWDHTVGAFVVPLRNYDKVLVELERAGCSLQLEMAGW